MPVFIHIFLIKQYKGNKLACKSLLCNYTATQFLHIIFSLCDIVIVIFLLNYISLGRRYILKLRGFIFFDEHLNTNAMKKTLMKMCALGLGAITFFGCQEDEDALMLKTNDLQKIHAENCDVIDFNQYEATITPVTEVQGANGMGPVMVMNQARDKNGIMVAGNRAVIFDMDNPTGDDLNDLYHPGKGKGLIIQQLDNDDPNNPTDEPNDNMWGGTMTLDFSAIGPVTIGSMTVYDIDTYEDKSYIRLYDGSGNMVKEHHLTPIGDGSMQIAKLNTGNVMKIVVALAGSNGYVGSGSVDDIAFCVRPPHDDEEGCTRTQGYWKTHGDPDNKKKYDNTWDPYVGATFFMSGMTYMGVLHEPVKGRAYFILAHQYIAAMLNVDAGASMPDDVLAAYNAATEYFESNKPAKKDAMHNQVTMWAQILDDYNNGRTGPGSCD